MVLHRGFLHGQYKRGAHQCHPDRGDEFPTPELSRWRTILSVGALMVCKQLLTIDAASRIFPADTGRTPVASGRRGFLIKINDLRASERQPVAALRQITGDFLENNVLFNNFRNVVSHKSLKLRLLI